MFTLRSLWYWSLGLIIILGLAPVISLYMGAAITDRIDCVQSYDEWKNLCETGYYMSSMGGLMSFLSIPLMFVGIFGWAVVFAVFNRQKPRKPESKITPDA